MKRGINGLEYDRINEEGKIGGAEERRKYSFEDSLMGIHRDAQMVDIHGDDEDDASDDDDVMDDEEEGPWFSMGDERGKRMPENLGNLV